MEIYKTIKNPLSTEKAIRLMESENKLLFIVDKKASKKDIKEAIEKMFKVKVEKVNTLIGPDGKKRAYVRFSDDSPAIDIATQLGLM
ncbi:50S ribosomal protein L23 [Candidatus Woesearchaeota archaeon]|nr:50S ribosomal protein L23 [Candidatus Woesearchaeota archaeon]